MQEWKEPDTTNVEIHSWVYDSLQNGFTILRKEGYHKQVTVAVLFVKDRSSGTLAANSLCEFYDKEYNRLRAEVAKERKENESDTKEEDKDY